MHGAPKPRLASAGVRLVAILLLLTSLHAALSAPAPLALAAACAGDEQILLAPAEPRVGGTLMVAALSRVAHERVVLLGPAGPIPVQRQPLGESFLWQEMIVLDHAGEHVFVFGLADGVSPLTRCADAVIHVAQADPAPLVAALNPYGANRSEVHGGGQSGASNDPASPQGDVAPPDDGESSGDAPQTRSERRPTRTPTPRPDNENENGNDNEAKATKTPTRTPTRTPTPRPPPTDTPEPTPTLAPASISSLSPSRPICGQSLAINGERFGDSRSAVDGEVRIDGRESSIDSWGMTRIQVKVPLTARAGNSRELEILVAGRSTKKEIAVTC